MLRRSVAFVAVVLVVGTTSAGCGAAGEANPEKIGPRGVDELVIPTPDPHPGDFVADVDNPWFPLEPGTVWTYDVTGGAVTRLEVRVEKGREKVDGVSCVVVGWTATDRDGVRVEEGRSYYAQDRKGNVWLFGEVSTRMRTLDEPDSSPWRAGEGGAEAGVAMLASPRVGDGYLRESSGRKADRVTIVGLDEQRTVPAGTFGGLLLTNDVSTLSLNDVEPAVVQRYYAEGIGLVEEATTVGGSRHVALASVRGP